MDVKKKDDAIFVSMEDYTKSLEKIEIRKGMPDDPLTEVEIKVFRKYVGKLSWLASNTRPDLAIYVLNSAKKAKECCVEGFKRYE